MMGDKPFSWMIGRFTDEKYANIFIKAVRKADIQSKNITYFIDKWDTEKNAFVK